MFWYAVGALFLIVIFLFIVNYNGFISLRNKLEEAYATMDVYLKKRYDLIPNLVETVKGYAAHEQETLENVIKARNLALTSQGLDQKQANETAFAGSLKSLFALSENYPELKADAGFRQLSEQLMNLENEISQARKYYNAVVKTFNSQIAMFPGNIVANLMNLTPYEYFMAESNERENVQVKF